MLVCKVMCLCGFGVFQLQTPGILCSELWQETQPYALQRTRRSANLNLSDHNRELLGPDIETHPAQVCQPAPLTRLSVQPFVKHKCLIFLPAFYRCPCAHMGAASQRAGSGADRRSRPGGFHPEPQQKRRGSAAGQ